MSWGGEGIALVVYVDIIILSIIVNAKRKPYEEGFENTAVLAMDEKDPLGG